MGEARHFLRMARTAPPTDVFILLITFFLTVFADLVVAVNVGVILAMLLFLRRMSSAVEVLQIDENALRAERSEEHTSELQSLMRISYAVFCLKKKKHDK